MVRITKYDSKPLKAVDGGVVMESSMSNELEGTVKSTKKALIACDIGTAGLDCDGMLREMTSNV